MQPKSKQHVLLVTPPFTQLNTPYPATAYLKGFLNTLGIESTQADLGIEVILELFSPEGLEAVFSMVDPEEEELSDSAERMFWLRNEYIKTIGPTIQFLQHKNPTLVHAICGRNYLPEASRFASLEELDWAFGSMGLQDRARHYATLYLEDLSDFIKETIDPHFGFSRYAERLGRTATHFDEMQAELEEEPNFVVDVLHQLLDLKVEECNPSVVCLSVPFPGNLFGALQCGAYLKRNFPEIKVVMGGGFANTELRRLKDPRVFDYLDFVCLDDGEAPLKLLLEHLNGERPLEDLKRTWLRKEGKVTFVNNGKVKDVAQIEVGTPDYSDFELDSYLSVIEVVNPMHRLWSDGRWNKLTLAHGCYWGKCSFCDISLDYIARYEPISAGVLCDRIEEIMEQTGQNGFHFVDEAAPPALMRDLALEIIRRGLTVVWWTNIRFEKSFTPDLCRLLQASGCIAVSGGLEVASDRLLALMKKGVTVAQVARVANAFTQAGIMVHAYLMYGFPTQTPQETVDSLEMVRQLFENGVVQSGFWHRFAMTAHSPVGLDPAAFGVMRVGPEFGGFADNDLYHEDPEGANHDLFGEGLRKSLFNFMHDNCLDVPVRDWFDFSAPPTSIEPDFIARSLALPEERVPRKNALLAWLGTPVLKREDDEGDVELIFFSRGREWVFPTDRPFGEWLHELLENAHHQAIPFANVSESLAVEEEFPDMDDLLKSPLWEEMKARGLVVV